jgi:splicing factor 3B subunit 3
MCLLDYDTIAGADKFGNIFTLRLPEGANDSVEVSSGARQLWDLGLLSGAPIKLNLLTHYFLGECVTSLVKTSLAPGGQEVLLASTVTGGVFAFAPFQAKDDVTFYTHLEMFLRQETAMRLVQRDHLSFRSFYQPVKDTVDGDLCEKFPSLPLAKQREFGADVDRSPAEIIKKLEDTRNIL